MSARSRVGSTLVRLVGTGPAKSHEDGGSRGTQRRVDVARGDGQTGDSLPGDREHRRREVDAHAACATLREVLGEMRRTTTEVQHQPTIPAPFGNDVEQGPIERELAEIVTLHSHRRPTRTPP